jgi:putative transposase
LGCQVSHQTVYNWIQKYVDLMETYVDRITPNVSNVWRTDELYLTVKKNIRYLFALIDDETRSWLAERVADKKGKSNERPMFAQV